MQFCSRTLKYLIDSFDVWWIGIRTSIKCGPDLDSRTELECWTRDGNIVNIVGAESGPGLSSVSHPISLGPGSDSARGLGNVFYHAFQSWLIKLFLMLCNLWIISISLWTLPPPQVRPLDSASTVTIRLRRRDFHTSVHCTPSLYPSSWHPEYLLRRMRGGGGAVSGAQ